MRAASGSKPDDRLLGVRWPVEYAALCVVWLLASACSHPGAVKTASSKPSTSPSPVVSSLDETTCERDQTFLSQLDTDYTDGTNYLNQQTADATYAQSRRLVGPYIKELQGYVKRLRSTATSAEYTPVRLGFLHGIQEIIKGLHLEYHNDGSSEAVQRGVDLSDQGFAELSTAYTALFDVSRRSCPGSTLALQSPGAG